MLVLAGIFLSISFSYSQTREDTLRFKQYYAKCQDVNVRDDVIMKMADTLIGYARDFEYEKGVTIALFFKQRHYSYLSNTDSLIYWTNAIKSHTLTTKERNHYFLAWRNLARYYMERRYYTLALKEIEQMPAVATKMNYIQGVIESHGMLATLYYFRGIYDKAVENMEKAILMDSEYNIKDFNIPTKYYYLTLSYIELGQYDKAEECLATGLQTCSLNSMRANIYRGYFKLYIDTKDVKNAKRIRDTLYLPKYTPNNSTSNLISLEAQYYDLLGDYNKEADCYAILKESRGVNSVSLQREAKCLQKLGRYKEASELYDKAYYILDSVQTEDTRNDIYAQLASIEVDSINAERNKLSQKLHESRMKYLTYGSIVLVIVLALFVYLTIRYQRLYKRLVKSESARTSFLNHISHEIRTPLNSIVGFSHLLIEEDMDKEEKDKCVDTISENSENLLRIITSAAEMSDVDDLGKTEETDINELCKSVADSYEGKVNSGVSLSVIPAISSPAVKINRAKIWKALSNIVDNSVKFTKEGAITINPSISNKNFTIIVTDSGPGIPKEKIDDIFDYFVTLNENGKGLGLGLSVTKQIAESLGGYVKVDTSYTDGCKIILSIPLS